MHGTSAELTRFCVGVYWNGTLIGSTVVDKRNLDNALDEDFMGRTLYRKNTRKLAANRAGRGRKAICESLEERQMMSLTVEVRGTDGSTSASVTSVGQVLNLELLAVISDPSNAPTQDGLQDVVGGIRSSAAQGHAVAGNLTAANAGHFTASGAAPGTFQDTNGDGNIDVGATDPTSTIGEFFARSSPLQTSANGTVVGNTLTFVIATVTYTVTNLNKGGATAINFVPFVSSTPDGAAWLEDNQAVNNTDGTYQAGTAFTVNDPALIVPPVAVNDNATVTKNTALDIKELANDDLVVPLNPASVVIVSNVAHGTTAVQSDGSVLYTPATDYLGADSFTYHVADTDGRVSNTATVNITVKLAPPPVAGAVAVNTLRNQAVTVNVVAQDSSVGTLIPSSVAVVTTPGNGTAVAQSDGTVLYTPRTGFTGTDTFTYTIADSNQETSNPGTVTVTVTTPVPPVANADSFRTSEGAPITLNLLSNDTSQSAALAPSTVDIDTTVQHGTTTVNADGSVLYTPTPGFTGTDSFTYTVADVLGDISNVAVVSLTIGPDVQATGGTTNTYALTGAATPISISSAVTSPAPLNLTTAALGTAAANGTVTVDSTTGNFNYTPNAGFIGQDSFTFTVQDVNGVTSTTGTVNVFVGEAVSNKGTAAKSITFTDGGGGLQTVSLNSGTADVYFSGTGTLAVAKNGKATVSGQSNLQIANIVLTGTNKASTLSVKGLASKPVTIGAISDTSALGTISAASAMLSGAQSFTGGLGTIKVASISGAQITVGAGSTGKLALTAGAVTDSGLTSAVPITALKVTSWTDGSAQTISAPSITSLTTTGAFDPSVTLTGKGVDLNSVKIGGAVSGGTWNVTGTVGTLNFGSVASGWAPTFSSSLNSLTIKTGGLASALAASTIGTLTIGGDWTAGLTTASAKSIKVTGGASGSTLSFTGAAGIKTLSIGGAVSNETITSVGNIGTVTVGSLSGSTISAGVASTVTVGTATAATLGTDTISSVKVTSKAAGAFAASSILASRLTSAAIGGVTTDNSGTTFGIATKSISNFTGTFANGPVHLGATQLKSETILQLYLTQQAIVFSDFSLAIQS